MTPQQRYYQANKEKFMNDNREYRRKNRDRVNALARKRYKIEAMKKWDNKQK
jgi:hypothetical protein